MHTCRGAHEAHAEVLGQLCGVVSLLQPLCKFWGPDSGFQDLTTRTLPAEPFAYPRRITFVT